MRKIGEMIGVDVVRGKEGLMSGSGRGLILKKM